MDKISRFFECLVPVTCCNLRCEYCYVHQQGRELGVMPKFRYTAKQIRAGFNKQRMGGPCYISICGSGETFLAAEVVDIAVELLKEGHYLNITNNGTITGAIKRLINLIAPAQRDRLLLTFSCHYLELKRLNLLTVFAENVIRAKEAGCSIYVKLNLCGSYLPFLEEIKAYCRANFNTLPQVAVTRKEGEKFGLYTEGSEDEYVNAGELFKSPRFRMELESLNNRQDKFCYAGSWSYKADLANGWIKQCYCNGKKVDIFSNPELPIPARPVGYKCKHKYCVNANIFYPLGVIPGVCDAATFSDIHDRPEAEWFTPKMKSFLSSKLYDTNKSKSSFYRLCAFVSHKVKQIRSGLRNVAKGAV